MEYLIFILLLPCYLLARIVSSLCASEIRDYADDWAERLAIHAARRLPSDQAAMFEEQWLADVQSVTGKSSKLYFAIGCLFASYRIFNHTIKVLNSTTLFQYFKQRTNRMSNLYALLMAASIIEWTLDKIFSFGGLYLSYFALPICIALASLLFAVSFTRDVRRRR